MSPVLIRSSFAFSVLALAVACGEDGGPTLGSGGATNSSGGAVGTGAAPGAGGGNPGAGGGNPGAGGGNPGAGGGNPGAGGSNPGAGGSDPGAGGSDPGAGGTDPGTGGSGTGGGADVDEGGKEIAKAGESTNVVQDYLRLGEIRILNNNWGSEDLGCTDSSFEVFVQQDKSFGWNFSRGNCDTADSNSAPDFPQVEFGIHPFGIGSHLVTSPEFSSTTLLPMQLKDIQSASVTLDSLNIALQNQTIWNLAMEFWLSEGDPRTSGAKVHTEVMGWWGWQNGRWACEGASDQVSAGDMSYTLCHQSDSWADGWRYYQFRAGDGGDGNIRTSFTGKVDVKSFLNYLAGKGYSGDLWLTRMEVGTEIDDNTSGKVTMKNITFEVNGMSRSAEISDP